MQTLQSLNWVDLLIMVIVLRTCSTGARLGFGPELYRLFGSIVTIVVGFHYYEPIAQGIVSFISLPRWLSRFIVLSLLLIIFRALFKYTAIFIFKFLTIRLPEQIEKVGGSVIGGVRGVLFGGFVLAILLQLPISYLNNSISEGSLLATRQINLIKSVYTYSIELIPSAKLKKLTISPTKK